MDSSPSINFKEEFSAKIPALTLLMNLGYRYRYLSPVECLKLRSSKDSSLQTPAYSATNSSNQVMLLPVLREFLTTQTYPFEGQQHHLSDSAIDKIISELNPAMNLGLTRANETLYDALLYGVNVTEFIDGKRASPTIQTHRLAEH